jgi:hypothetical protein
LRRRLTIRSTKRYRDPTTAFPGTGNDTFTNSGEAGSVSAKGDSPMDAQSVSDHLEINAAIVGYAKAVA